MVASSSSEMWVRPPEAAVDNQGEHFALLQRQIQDLVKQMGIEHGRVRGEHTRLRAELTKALHSNQRTNMSQADEKDKEKNVKEETSKPNDADEELSQEPPSLLPEGFTGAKVENASAEPPGAVDQSIEDVDEEKLTKENMQKEESEDEEEEDEEEYAEKPRRPYPPPSQQKTFSPPTPKMKARGDEEEVDELQEQTSKDGDSDASVQGSPLGQLLPAKPEKKKGVSFLAEDIPDIPNELEESSKPRTHGRVKLTLKPEWRLASKADLKEIRRDSHLHNGVLRSNTYDGGLRINNNPCARLSQKVVTHPSSRIRVAFDMLGMLFLSYDLVMIPLGAFHEYIGSESFFVKDVGFVSSLFWAFDMVSTFFLGFHTKGQVELNMDRIALRYLRTWFIMDFLLVTLDFAFIIMGLGQNASALRIGKTLSRGARVLRLLRIVKMHNIISNLVENIQSEYLRTFLSIIGIMVAIILANHFIACGWYMLSYWGTDEDDLKKNWRSSFLIEPEHDRFGYRYATSLHWSLTQFTPASMEVYPKNTIERLYSVVILLFAMVAFSSFISSITQAMTHLREMNARGAEEEALLRRYLNQHGISGEMVNRVWHYLHQQEVINFGRVRTKAYEVNSLTRLPKSMRVELALESFGPALKKHPFFKHLFFHDQPAVRQICYDCVQELSLLSRQELFSQDDDQVCMFFVMEGILEYALPCKCSEVPQDILDMENNALGEEDKGEVQEESATHQLVRSFTTKVKETVKSTITAQPAEAGAATIVGSRWADRIKSGEWACEAALWSRDVKLAGPFTALVQSEVIMIKTEVFMATMAKHEYANVKAAQYGQSFTDYIEHMTNCRWRTVIANDFSTLEDLVHRIFNYTGGTSTRKSEINRLSGEGTEGVGRLSRVAKSVRGRVSSMISSSSMLTGRKSEFPGARHSVVPAENNSEVSQSTRSSRVQPVLDNVREDEDDEA